MPSNDFVERAWHESDTQAEAAISIYVTREVGKLWHA
jgi:hypothetical protein